MNIDQILINNNLGPFDIDDQQVVGRELLIGNLENAIETFLQFYDKNELMEIVDEFV